jgi:hypothetical protein
MGSLNSVELKIFRAAQHFESLQSELGAYFKSNPGKMVRQPHTCDNEAVFRFVSKEPVPTRFGLIMGDILQNLRSALDYLVWELVLAANNQPTEKNMFPVCSSLESFMHQVGRHRLDGIAADALAEIKGLQPFNLGPDANKSILLAIEELANINKHRRILLTNLAAAPLQSEQVLVQDNAVWIHDSAGGRTRLFDRDTQFGPFPIIDGKVKMDTQIMAAVTFDEGCAKGMEISSSVMQWSHYIANVMLPRFEKFVP